MVENLKQGAITVQNAEIVPHRIRRGKKYLWDLAIWSFSVSLVMAILHERWGENMVC